ncbi:MAG: hypothetical protein Q8O67_15765 [Deltaproteobacteria bacterium]|nr:hypothetical protein [Deltaproteobacteria bacterium]
MPVVVVAVVVEDPPPVKLAIFARRRPQPEPQCDRFRSEALQRGHEVRDADVAAFVSGPIQLDIDVDIGGPILIGGVRVDDVDAVILGPLPGPAARTSPPGVMLSSSEHAALTTRQYERHALAWSIVTELEARGVAVFSSPTRARPFDFKPAQLMALARAGLPVPPTRITDVDGPAGDDVDKPIAGGPVRSAGALVRGAPVIRQARLRGVDLRAVVVGDQVVALGRFPGDDDVIDLRERPAFADGSGRWEHDDDDVAASLALRAARVCQCDFAAVDLKRSARGLTILEVNRTPVVLDIEDDVGVPIAALFIDWVEASTRARRR